MGIVKNSAQVAHGFLCLGGWGAVVCFGWMAVWVWAQTGVVESRNLENVKLPCLRWSAGRVHCLHYILTFTLQLRKNNGKTYMVPEKCLAEQCQAWFFVSNWPPFVLVFISLMTSVAHKRPGSTLIQRKYLPSCRNKELPTPRNLESKFFVRALMWSAKYILPRSSWIFLLPIYGRRFIGGRAKALGLKHPRLPDMGASDGPSDGTCLVHHWTNELLIKQNSASDGETTPPVQERTQPPSLWATSFLFWSIWGNQVSSVSRVTPR